MIRVLTVAGSEVEQQRIASLLSHRGIEVQSAPGSERLADRLDSEDFDVLVIERHSMPDPALAFLGPVSRRPEPPTVIVLTREERPADRAQLLARGCRAVLWLGLDDTVLGETLLALVGREEEHDVLGRWDPSRAKRASSLDDFVAASPVMQRFLHLARRVVKSESPLLILGETGVGKERVARSIHAESPRSRGPWITVNCGALPETLLESELFGHEEGAFTGATRSRRGYFELAHRGTIFLDEIGEMPYHLQVRLLRVIEDRHVRRVGGEKLIEVDVRVIAATNRDLHADMKARRFRPDLYYRLAVVTLNVPPLRERREDIPELARTFLEHFRGQFGGPAKILLPSALEALQRYEWPGNVRELMNVVERAVLLSTRAEIGLADLRGGGSWATPSATGESAAVLDGGVLEAYFDEPLATAKQSLTTQFERDYLARLLKATRGRVGAAARRAGVTERTLYGLMKRHGLRKEDYRSSGPVRDN